MESRIARGTLLPVVSIAILFFGAAIIAPANVLFTKTISEVESKTALLTYLLMVYVASRFGNTIVTPASVLFAKTIREMVIFVASYAFMLTVSKTCSSNGTHAVHAHTDVFFAPPLLGIEMEAIIAGAAVDLIVLTAIFALALKTVFTLANVRYAFHAAEMEPCVARTAVRCPWLSWIQVIAV